MNGNRLTVLVALASLILLGMWWLRPRHVAGPQTVTLEGRLPQDPNAEVRAYFPDLNYTATCRASELGQPGQPFQWKVQVPGKPGQVQMQTARPHLPPVSGVPVAVHSSGSVQVSPPPAPPVAAAPTPPTPQDARRIARQNRRRERSKQRRLAIRNKHREHQARTR